MSDSAKKRLKRARDQRYRAKNKPQTISVFKDDSVEIRTIGKEKQLTVKQVISMLLATYRARVLPRTERPTAKSTPLPVASHVASGSQTPRYVERPTATSTPLPVSSHVASGSQTPRYVESLPFFNSPLAPKCRSNPSATRTKRGHNEESSSAAESLPFFNSPLAPKCRSNPSATRTKRGHNEESSSAAESGGDVMSGVERMSESDRETGIQSRGTTVEDPTTSGHEASDFNISVDYREIGDFIYPQEKVEEPGPDEKDEIWHPSHVRNKSLCKGLDVIDDPEAVFGGEEEEETAHSVSGLHQKITAAKDATNDQLFLITKTMLAALARQARPICKRCQQSLRVQIDTAGTSAHVTWTCDSGHTSRFCTQGTINGSHVGDIRMSSAILLSGNNFHKIERMAEIMNLHMFSSRLFIAVQNHYVCPVIEEKMNNLLSATKDRLKDQQVVLCGDARNDSPGFCAQYCTYTLLDHNTKDIVDVQFLDKRETGGKSGAMEPLGMMRALDSLKAGGITISELVTDAHPTISAILKRDYPEICHSWDIWHGAKNIGKKISMASKTVANKQLKYWTKHVVNHFWFCAESCGGDVKLFLSKWRGLVHHVTDKHEWAITGGLGGVAHCEHGDLEERTESEWLSSGTKAHDTLVRLVLDKRLLKTLVHFVNFRHTGELESLHSHILMYCGKRFAFGWRAYRARNMLAMIDYTMHKDRPLDLDEQGNPKHKARWSKHAGDWVVHQVRVRKTYSYMPGMVEEILCRRLNDSMPLFRPAELLPTDPRRICPRLAPVPPPSKEELVQRRKSRFSVE